MPTVLHSAVTDSLGADITSGDLPAGTSLTLDAIQRRFGVSRTVAREAMRALEHLGLVISRRRVGLVVRPASDWAVFDPQVIRWRLAGPERIAQLRSLTELRAAIEPLAAAGTARNADGDQADRLVALAARLHELGAASTDEEFLAADIEFHHLLLTASGNEMFGALTDVVAEVLIGRTRHGLMPARPHEEALTAHAAVAAAVRRRDPDGAERAMERITRELRSAIDGLT